MHATLENILSGQGHARVYNPRSGNGHSIYEALLSSWPRTSELTGREPIAPHNQKIPARRTIYRSHELSEALTVICSGWAACISTLSDGRRQILSFLLPGDLVSTIALFGQCLPYEVQALTDVNYCTFDSATLRPTLFSDSDLLRQFLQIWAEEKERADELAIDLGRRSADERIARLMLNLLRRLRARDLVHDETFEFPLRQQHIADATGLTPVHVSRVISEFRRAGLIQITDRCLTVLKSAELCQIGGM
jgi:CRP-like cAMP-binding protein